MDSRHSLAQILVVAPNADLRNSLAFMLQAEGFSVEACVAWEQVESSPLYLAMVIDHGSFSKGFSGDARLDTLGSRLIILASHLVPPRGIRSATMVRKPIHTAELLNAVTAAISHART